MFTTTTKNLSAPQPLSIKIQGEFAISFSRLADGSRLACYHSINDGVIGEGSPVSFTGVCSVIDSVRDENSSGEKKDFWCNPRILYRSNSHLMWYRPSGGYTPLWFRVNGGCCVKAKLPTLVFCYSHDGGGLTVFAATRKAVTQDTPLFHAPLCNINGSGNLCYGTADKAEPYSPDSSIIQISEDAVLKSMFSHVNHNKTFISDTSVDTAEHIRIWQALCEKDVMPSAKELVKTSLKVRDLVGE